MATDEELELAWIAERQQRDREAAIKREPGAAPPPLPASVPDVARELEAAVSAALGPVPSEPERGERPYFARIERIPPPPPVSWWLAPGGRERFGPHSAELARRELYGLRERAFESEAPGEWGSFYRGQAIAQPLEHTEYVSPAEQERIDYSNEYVRTQWPRHLVQQGLYREAGLAQPRWPPASVPPGPVGVGTSATMTMRSIPLGPKLYSPGGDLPALTAGWYGERGPGTLGLRPGMSPQEIRTLKDALVHAFQEEEMVAFNLAHPSNIWEHPTAAGRRFIHPYSYPLGTPEALEEHLGTWPWSQYGQEMRRVVPVVPEEGWWYQGAVTKGEPAGHVSLGADYTGGEVVGHEFSHVAEAPYWNDEVAQEFYGDALSWAASKPMEEMTGDELHALQSIIDVDPRRGGNIGELYAVIGQRPAAIPLELAQWYPQWDLRVFHPEFPPPSREHYPFYRYTSPGPSAEHGKAGGLLSNPAWM